MIASAIGLAYSVPIAWTTRNAEETVSPVTVVPWKGTASTSGAFLIARINLGFLQQTCHKYAADLDVAIQVSRVLINTKLTGATNNQIKRYGYLLLKLETVVK